MTKIETISIVVPVYNEESVIDEFYKRIHTVLTGLNLQSEIIFVNDGSTDSTVLKIYELQKNNSRVKILDLSRNFGHQAALKAGLDHADGDAVVIIDADLQDPPETISRMLAEMRKGYDVVYALRPRRAGETWFKKAAAAVYYRLIKIISPVDLPLDAGDFRMMSSSVVRILRSMKERNLYLRGLISWIGFRQTGILIDRDPRYAGRTKYTLSKMLQLAWSGITNFSFLPLQITTWIGCFTMCASFILMLDVLYVAVILHKAVQGWASIMVSVLFLGSVQLITLGILGGYLARNYDESRSRPVYIIREKIGFNDISDQ